jgi:hypothetical protein
MYTHLERLELLARALRIGRERVVPTLRKKTYQYYDASGALLFDGAAAWSDDRLVEAAFNLFVMLEPPKTNRGIRSQRLPRASGSVN